MTGLGDLVAFITKYTGIQWFFNKLHIITGFECGCQKRRRKLNRMVPFKKSTK
jgi:hypothetical protein